MTKRTPALLLAVFVSLPLYAGGFRDLVRALDAQHGVNKVWIPFLGMARVAVRMIEPEGVRDFQLAVFRVSDGVEPRSLQRVMREKIGPDFTPLVQARSRKGEWTFIYVRPHGADRVELIVLAHDDDHEAALVRVELDADVLARELGQPRGVVHLARR